MIDNNKQMADAAEMAQFRFALIAPVIHNLYTDSSRTAYYKRITKDPLTFPDGSVKKISYRTVEKWVSLYSRFGIDGITPRSRDDKGSTRALNDAAIEEIYRLKKEFPRLNATQIYNQLISGGFIPATVNVSAVQRFIKKNDLKGARNPNVRDRKAFEEDAFGKMWQCDTCYFPHITENGVSRRVYAVCIIDDHSRMIVGSGLFYSDSAYNFQKVFKNAVATYGIPNKLYTDNGSPYVNAQLALICGSIGTVLLHTKVRDGASKAKIERFWRTTKERWVYAQDFTKVHSLAELNIMFTEYIRAYNTTMHSGIGCTPLDRYEKTRENIRKPESMEWLDESFLNRVERRVRKDSTVSIDKVSFDVPMQFISQKVEIRYLPDDLDHAFILYDGEHFPIRKTDRNANCHTKRNNLPAIDYSKLKGDSDV